MVCSCGGFTNFHRIIRNKTEVGSFNQCPHCGRVHWLRKPSLPLDRATEDKAVATNNSGLMQVDC